jgi:hypothetical protein
MGNLTELAAEAADAVGHDAIAWLLRERGAVE